MFLVFLTISTNAQKFGTLSGTIRVGGGIYGTVYSYCAPVTLALCTALSFTDFTVEDANNWSNEQHGFFRFFNIGGDVLIPNWSMSSSNINIELLRPYESYQEDSFLDGGMKQYTTYLGYYFNWKSLSTRFGGYFGADYEWKNFVIHYPYPNVAYNKIHSVVPSVGLRYRLLSPMTEIGGFPFNVVFEAGLSYVICIKYKNNCGYGSDALNNGFRSMLGVAITTNRFGAIHVRWSKDLYNIFNEDYAATDGFLYNNTITNDFSCISIGWAIFL